MFQRFHAMRERDESGFTLIELLVVILIIAILAAIAIPVFLNQRKKGWVSQTESALKNASLAVETIAAGDNGDYSDALAAGCIEQTCDQVLVDAGFTGTTNVTIEVTEADTSGYCIDGTHALSGDIVMVYDSDVGTPDDGSCTP